MKISLLFKVAKVRHLEGRIHLGATVRCPKGLGTITSFDKETVTIAFLDPSAATRGDTVELDGASTYR